ncbi:hypothetical protein HDU84_009267, partial [Entophlyctis sp. JEL0112]
RQDAGNHNNMHAMRIATPRTHSPTLLTLPPALGVVDVGDVEDEDDDDDDDDDDPAESIDDVNATPLPDFNPSLARANPTCLFP